MADLRDLLEQAAGAAPPPLPVALVRGQAAIRRRRRRRNRIVIGLAAAAAVVVAAVVVSRPAAPRPDPADSHRVRKVTIGPLPSGRYLGRVAGTPVTFTIPPGRPWLASRVNADDLVLSDPGVPFSLQVTRWTSVYTYDSRGVALAPTRPVPAVLVQWLQARPGLNVVGPVTATRLAGRPAHLLEIVMSAAYEPRTRPQGAPESCGLPSNCITLGSTPAGPVVLHTRSFMLLVVTDGPAQDRLVAMVSIPVDVPIDSRAVTGTVLQVLESFSPAP